MAQKNVVKFRDTPIANFNSRRELKLSALRANFSNAKFGIIGMGPGASDYLIPAAKSRIEKADCLIGAERHLISFHYLGKEEILLDGQFDKAIRYIKKFRNRKKIAVLVSGDPGIYSLLEKLSKAFGARDYHVIPGISALQLAFARIGESWRDAKIISLHGRRPSDLAAEIKYSDKAFFFTDPSLPPDRIAKVLLKEGIDNRRVFVLERLSYPDERIIDTDLRRLSGMKGFGLCVMIIRGRLANLHERPRIARRPVKADEAILSERLLQPLRGFAMTKAGTYKGKLYGLGIGPGDPKLITLKAKEILDAVDIIFVPRSSEDDKSYARSIVEAVITGKKIFEELTFPMTKDKAILNKYWKKAARAIAKQVRGGRKVAFITIGDPFIYSTYIYLLKMLRGDYPDVDIETVPGISSINAAASAAGLSLGEGNERIAVVPVTSDLAALRGPLKEFDTVVLMKVGSKLSGVVSLLKEMGLARQSVLVSRVGNKDEKIVHDLDALRGKKAGYMSVIIVRSKS